MHAHEDLPQNDTHFSSVETAKNVQPGVITKLEGLDGNEWEGFYEEDGWEEF